MKGKERRKAKRIEESDSKCKLKLKLKLGLPTNVLRHQSVYTVATVTVRKHREGERKEVSDVGIYAKKISIV